MAAHRHRKRHDTTWIVLGAGILITVDMLAWVLWIAWHLLPILLPVATLVLASRRWHLPSRAWARIRGRSVAPAAPRLVRGQVVNEPALDRAELARLRDDNAKLRAKVRVLSDMVNGPEVRQ